MELYRDSLGLNLRGAHWVLTRRLKRVLAPIGLKLTEFVILRSLGDQDGMSLVEIGRLSRRSTNQLNPAAKSLKKKGFVRALASDSDKRVNHLFLTEAGKEILKKIGELRDRVVGNAGLEPIEYETLRKLAGKVVATDEEWGSFPKQKD